MRARLLSVSRQVGAQALSIFASIIFHMHHYLRWQTLLSVLASITVWIGKHYCLYWQALLSVWQALLCPSVVHIPWSGVSSHK